MCFWHSDAQIAIGVAENGLAQGSPGQEGTLRDVILQRTGARGGRVVSLKDSLPQGFKLEGLKAWGLQKINHIRQTEKSKDRKIDYLSQLKV